MDAKLRASAQRVQNALTGLGLALKIVEMPATTRTAQEAAAAIGCTVAQIAKSIVFRGAATGKAVLVVASGINRVNENVIESRCGEPLQKATSDFVRSATGFAIGGVPPVGFSEPLETWIDEDLLQYAEVWAAAGTPFAVFAVDPKALPGITGGRIVKVV